MRSSILRIKRRASVRFSRRYWLSGLSSPRLTKLAYS
ncbi:hypothetical protein MGSAQ_000649 [marine sediment metagenome]|uniref:Uncharacterized protein n=1 Tax=marine sediment metagenome TaxID=412755 RepID=A0A1B6NWN5_9ZZZZ